MASGLDAARVGKDLIAEDSAVCVNDDTEDGDGGRSVRWTSEDEDEMGGGEGGLGDDGRLAGARCALPCLAWLGG